MKQNNKKFNNAMLKFVEVLDKRAILLEIFLILFTVCLWEVILDPVNPE